MYRHAHLKNSCAIVKCHQHPVCALAGVHNVKDTVTLEMSETDCWWLGAHAQVVIYVFLELMHSIDLSVASLVVKNKDL